MWRRLSNDFDISMSLDFKAHCIALDIYMGRQLTLQAMGHIGKQTSSKTLGKFGHGNLVWRHKYVQLKLFGQNQFLSRCICSFRIYAYAP